MTADDLAWMQNALCAETDLEAFFPEKGGSTLAAKRICAECDVRARCLAYALEHDQREGVWGGMSANEREQLVKGTYQPGKTRAVNHGTRTMWTRGCKDEELCPRGADGRSCAQARRDYQNKWVARKRANGGRAA